MSEKDTGLPKLDDTLDPATKLFIELATSPDQYNETPDPTPQNLEAIGELVREVSDRVDKLYVATKNAAKFMEKAKLKEELPELYNHLSYLREKLELFLGVNHEVFRKQFKNFDFKPKARLAPKSESKSQNIASLKSYFVDLLEEALYLLQHPYDDEINALSTSLTTEEALSKTRDEILKVIWQLITSGTPQE
jgi:hypothetical protein